MLIGSGDLVTLLVELIIGGIIVYAVYLFLNMLSLPSPVRTIIMLLIAVMAIVFLAQIFGIRV